MVSRMFFGFFMLACLTLIGLLIHDMVVTRTTVYQLEAKVYAFDQRTTGYKSSKRHNIVHVSVVYPNGARSAHSTGQHTSKCPFVDMHTPVRMEVTNHFNQYTGETRRWRARLLTQPCRLQ